MIENAPEIERDRLIPCTGGCLDGKLIKYYGPIAYGSPSRPISSPRTESSSYSTDAALDNHRYLLQVRSTASGYRTYEYVYDG